MSMRQIALEFFDACETGKGWDVCKQYCHEGASFACQADALAEISTLEGNTGCTKGLLGPMPDIHYELNFFGIDEERSTVCGAAIIRGTHTEDAGSPPTGKSLAGDYCYIMKFDGDKIAHMTKIWNDWHSLKQLGWA